MNYNTNDWHSLIDLSKKAKENYMKIEERYPGLTNYEAVKKYIQRAKKSPAKKQIFKNKPSTETATLMESVGFCNPITQIFNRHHIKVEDAHDDIKGFTYADYSQMFSAGRHNHYPNNNKALLYM